MADLDTLVLGCTHFPLIKDEIQLCLPQVKYFMDPSAAIAKRIKYLLDDKIYKCKMKNIIKCFAPHIFPKNLNLKKLYIYGDLNLWK